VTCRKRDSDYDSIYCIYGSNVCPVSVSVAATFSTTESIEGQVSDIGSPQSDRLVCVKTMTTCIIEYNAETPRERVSRLLDDRKVAEPRGNIRGWFLTDRKKKGVLNNLHCIRIADNDSSYFINAAPEGFPFITPHKEVW